ncbi:MAG: hypothetical protein R3B59_03470 [Dehalococcoidia bacterium]
MFREWLEVIVSTLARLGLKERITGILALTGSLTWFIIFLGPQWGFLAWGYRPNAIMLGSALVSSSLVGEAIIMWSRWSVLRRIGSAALLLGVLLVGAQAPLGPPFAGGVSFDTAQDAPVRGLGVYWLPIAVSLLVLAWGFGRAPRRAASLVPGFAALTLAITLLFPPQTGWFDLWDFVFRYAYLLGALVMVGWSGYQLLGGPIPEVTWHGTTRLRGVTSPRP